MKQTNRGLSSVLSDQINAERWNQCKTEQDRRLEWIRAKGVLWDIEKESSSIEELVNDSISLLLIKEQFTADQINKFENIRDNDKTTSLMFAAYLLNEGLDYLPSKKYVLDRVNSLLARHSVQHTHQVQRRKQSTNNTKRTRVMETLEQMGDNKLHHAANFDNVFSEHQIDREVAVYVTDYYRLILNEFKNIRTDPELRYAYKHYSGYQQRKIIKWYETLIEHASKYIDAPSKKKIRKVRKSKPKSASKLASKVKYLRSDPKLGVQSISADQIIGARAVLYYNVKTRNVHYVVSQTKLSISRSSIQDFDPELSFRKKLRKPKQQIEQLTSSTRLFAVKTLNSIKAKNAETTGRINDSTLILKVFNK